MFSNNVAIRTMLMVTLLGFCHRQHPCCHIEMSYSDPPCWQQWMFYALLNISHFWDESFYHHSDNMLLASTFDRNLSFSPYFLLKCLIQMLVIKDALIIMSRCSWQCEDNQVLSFDTTYSTEPQKLTLPLLRVRVNNAIKQTTADKN